MNWTPFFEFGRLGKRRQWFVHVRHLFVLIVSDWGMEFNTRCFWQGIRLGIGWDPKAEDYQIGWRFWRTYYFQERITYAQWLDSDRTLI